MQSLLNASRHLCCCLQPMPVPAPTQLAASMEGLRTDDELSHFISGSKGGGTAVVEFGTTWCVKCHEMFPQFFALSRKVCAGSYVLMRCLLSTAGMGCSSQQVCWDAAAVPLLVSVQQWMRIATKDAQCRHSFSALQSSVPARQAAIVLLLHGAHIMLLWSSAPTLHETPALLSCTYCLICSTPSTSMLLPRWRPCSKR